MRALEGLDLSSLVNLAGTWTVRSIAYAVYGLVPKWVELRHGSLELSISELDPGWIGRA